MTVKNAIAFADGIRPNAFQTGMKLDWLNRMEHEVASSVMGIALPSIEAYTEESMDYELIVPMPFDDLYALYLIAMIDMANGEYTKYQNSYEVYNQRYREFVCWFAATYNPANQWRSGRDCACCCKAMQTEQEETA